MDQGATVTLNLAENPKGEHQLTSLSQVDLCIPGPEQPLVDGVERVFRKGEPRSPFSRQV